MSRFYDTSVAECGCAPSYRVSIATPHGKVDISVSETLHEEINALQREFWRTERRESRHTLHIEQMNDCDLPHARLVKSPEQLLIERLEAEELQRAIRSIPAIQQRRFLLRYAIGLPIKRIAQIEGCSERAVKYSLALARRNLREILS